MNTFQAIEKNISQSVSEPLSRRVVRGGLWVFALRLINHVLRFIRIIILARLLAPQDFGLLGIAMLSISALEIFSQTGFHAALIQKKDGVKSHLDTAWTISAIRGVILFVILYLSAPVAANFFNSSEAVLVIRIIAISTLFAGFRNIGIVFFRKEMEFKKQFFYEFSATFVDLTVAITLAFILRNVWALVWGGLAANLTRLYMSYVLQTYRPRIRFQREKFNELFDFGKWVLASSILVFLVTQGDDVFIAKLLGITALGLYQVAYTLSNLPATEITHVIAQVTFPAYAKIQDDPLRLTDAYLTVLQLTAFLSFPLTAAIIVLAPQFIDIFMGHTWLPTVPLVQVLALAGLARSIAATAGYLFYALGKTKIDTVLQVIRLATLAVAIYPLTLKFKLLGVPIAVFLSNFISNIGFCIMACKLTKCNKTQFIKLISIPLINGIIVALIIESLKKVMGKGIFELVIFFFFGSLIYLIISYLSEKLLNYQITDIKSKIILSLKNT